MDNDWRHGGFGLYIHWPFCEAKCPYCDFNSYVNLNVDAQLWEDALISELDRNAKLTSGRLLNSIFFGGGTPSLMPPSLVEKLISRAYEHWMPANDIEITLEANPSSVEAERFSGFKTAGVNRVSVGIQALNNPDLKKLGRLHSVDDAMLALEVAHRHFDRVSFDLIYGRQNQSLSSWETELTRAISLNSGHLSLYQLTIEPGTAFGYRANAGKLTGLPNEDLSADMFEFTDITCASAGLNSYEVSNFSSEGLESKHNLIYWMGGDYIGIGPGAHGRITSGNQRLATKTMLSPAAWLDAVHLKSSGELAPDILSNTDHANELIMMGLRLKSGISQSRLEAVVGKKFDITTELTDLGLLNISDGFIKATNSGRALLNQVIQKLMF
ncbi:MAG: radical SAM family heme chaperone HemW [Planktomarina sp.]|nr:radical SAM family heme chaperone HemW [Planktomarina sp.]